jgi:hypothetical protein
VIWHHVGADLTFPGLDLSGGADLLHDLLPVDGRGLNFERLLAAAAEGQHGYHGRHGHPGRR